MKTKKSLSKYLRLLVVLGKDGKGGLGGWGRRQGAQGEEFPSPWIEDEEEVEDAEEQGGWICEGNGLVFS